MTRAPRLGGRREGDLVADPGRRCRRGARLRRAGSHRGEARLTTRGNAVNPRIGSGMQQARTVEEEEPVEVVRNHEGGTRTRLVASSRRPGGDVRPGVDSPTFPMEGRSLDNPRRGCPAAMPGGTDRAAVGKDGAKVTRGARVHPDGWARGPVDGPSRAGPRGSGGAKVVEGGGEVPSKSRRRPDTPFPARRKPAARRGSRTGRSARP